MFGPTLFGRALLGLLSLGLGLSLLPPAPAARAQEAMVTVEAKWLFLRMEDFKTDQMVQLDDRVTDDGRAKLTERQFDPKWRGAEDHPPVPSLTLNRIWQATDTATARAIFQEQANAGFAEARTSVPNAGGLEVPGLGEEAAGITGCSSDCSVIHTRIVFRYWNAVEVLYVYGPKDFAYREIAVGWSKILDERIRALAKADVAAAPKSDEVRAVFPKQLVITAAEVGSDANEVGSGEGSDARGSWAWVRAKRPIEASRQHLGPAEVYSKVWVAPDIETAQAIYAEQARPGLPEAEQPFGADFPMDFTPDVGNDNFGWSGCNDNCNTEKFNRLHQRQTTRIGNVVAVIYIWGENQSTSINQLEFYFRAMKGRMP
jgi:hypothetical protein